MNLPAIQVPQLVILLSKVYQHNRGLIVRASQLGSCTNTVKLEPDNGMLMKINNKGCLDELVAFPTVRALALVDDVPFCLPGTNNDLVTVCTKVQPGPDARDDEGIVLGRVEDPLRNDMLVNKSHNGQLQIRTSCFGAAEPTTEEGGREVYDCERDGRRTVNAVRSNVEVLTGVRHRLNRVWA